jgi:2-methylcitrate dehydratase PrpD
MVVNEFVHECGWGDLPDVVKGQARRCLLDVLGTAVGGRMTPVSSIIHDFAAMVYGGQGAYLWFDGREVSPPGAALANGMTIDSLDIHDGHNLTKGHAGAAVVPAVFATLTLNNHCPVSGEELLTSLVIGYEVALRVGIAQHRTCCDYHTSGAWNALGCAAVTARRMGLDREKTRHALGTAEYHGPRSQMMRCIDYPTMVKDGSGWGAMAGVSAALMAAAGFTGAPALTVESAEAADIWSDLGSRWRILEQYFKPHAVCRWAQPAVEGALALYHAGGFELDEIETIEVHTFHEGVRLAMRRPKTTEEAQYSLPFPVAAALVHGRLGPEEVSGEGLGDAAVLALADRIKLIEDEGFNEVFPGQRFARVVVQLQDGRRLDSGQVGPKWDGTQPPTDEELLEKFRWLAGTRLSSERIEKLLGLIWESEVLEDVVELEKIVCPE